VPADGATESLSTATGRFPVGARTLGRWRVVRRLGSGGFARVYRAHDEELDVDVAIKLLRPELAADEELVERFRREAMTAVRLRHPNVVTVLTVGRLDSPFDGAAVGTPYLVMDFLPGSLAGRITDAGPLHEAEVARLGAEVARGLAYAHRQGIVHRDVKPENVLLAADGRAVVTDFGIARAVSEGTASATRDVVLGTPAYFSPEQARGLPCDGRSDVYSLGISLFQLATGTLPFSGGDWYEVMRRHVDDPVPSARERTPTLSPTFDAIVSRCLAKDPDERWRTADELADALEALSGPDGETVIVTPLARASGGNGAASRGRPATPKTPILSAPPAAPPSRWPLVGGALALLVAVGGAAFWLRSDGAARTRERLALRGTADSIRAATPVDPPPAPTIQPVAALQLSAPPGADLFLDGVRVGRGAWATDSLAPGPHRVRATVPALRGCPSADTTISLELGAAQVQRVQLNPTGCGRVLVFSADTNARRWTLTPRAGGRIAEGTFPVRAPLLLPAGRYRLTISGTPACTQFVEENVEVPATGAVVRTPWFKLICG
jgi:serine/threonine-protein kinase